MNLLERFDSQYLLSKKNVILWQIVYVVGDGAQSPLVAVVGLTWISFPAQLPGRS